MMRGSLVIVRLREFKRSVHVLCMVHICLYMKIYENLHISSKLCCLQLLFLLVFGFWLQFGCCLFSVAPEPARSKKHDPNTRPQCLTPEEPTTNHKDLICSL